MMEPSIEVRKLLHSCSCLLIKKLGWIAAKHYSFSFTTTKSALLKAADLRSVRYHTPKCSLWIFIVSRTLLVLIIYFGNLCHGQCTVF